MRILVKTETKTDYIYIPMTESNLQKTCDKFGIANDMKSTVKIEEDYNSSELSKLLSGKDVVLDELNFLAKSLDKYSTNENDIFYAVAEGKKLDNLKDLINLSFNESCYHYISDFKDLNTLGKTLYLNEHGAASIEFLESFDKRAYITDIMQNNRLISASTNGLVYASKNEPQELYNGKTYPLYFYDSPPITLEIENSKGKEYLFLPCEQSEVSKALERIEANSIDEVAVSIAEDALPENIMEIGESTDFNEINDFAKLMLKVGFSEHKYLSKLVDITKVDNPKDLETLANSMFEVEILPNIKTAEMLGKYMIMESERFNYDENLESYIDFERFGREKIQNEKGIFINDNYFSYMGFNKEMIELLNKNLNMGLEFEEYSETLKLYMPLKVESFYEEDDYGRYHPSNYAEEIDSSELCGWEEELNEFINNYQDHYETDRKLMEYYNESDSVNAKVHALHFEFEQVDGDMYGVAVAELVAPLSKEELDTLSTYCESQSSDGLGEGLEQQDFHFEGRDINIHLWNSDNDWYIKTADEMGFKEQNYGMGGMQ